METTTFAVIYSRNSSAKQKSIDEQAAENRATVEAEGWTIARELSDPSSASRYATKARKNWAELMTMLPEIDVVVLWEPSRGDRTLASWAQFLDACRANGVRIRAVTHQRTYDPRNARDYRSLAEDGVDSAYESDKIAERTRRGLAGSMAAGRPHGALAHGYRRRYDERGNYAEQVACSAAGPVVRDIFAAVAGGESLHALCGRLTRGGVPTPRGGRLWYSSTITGIVRNEVYRPHSADPARGRRTHDGRVLDAPAAWPPLVDETTWQAANRILATNDELARRRRRDSAPGAIKYLLSGNSRVMAAPCGSQLSGYPPAAGSARAASYSCRHDTCVSAPMLEVDEYVTRLVVARMSKADVRDLWVADDTATRAAVDELARLRAELEDARQSWLTPGGISAGDWAAKCAVMEPLIGDAERRARPAGVPLAALRLIEAARLGADRVRPTWNGFLLSARRGLVADLFAELMLGPLTVRITRWTPPPERLAIVAGRISHDWRRPAR